MPELLIMRHAKSDWSSETGRDHDRPLAERGIKAARRMGRWLTAAGFAPQLVLSSSALRARTTAALAAETGEWSCPVEVIGSLYGISAEGTFAHIAEAPSGVDRVLVVGHEPTMSSLVGLLAGGAQVRMPTAAVACVSTSVKRWSSLREGCGELLWLVTPKLLRRKC